MSHTYNFVITTVSLVSVANPRVLSSGCSVQLAAGYNSDQAKKIIKNPVPYSSVGIVQNQGKTLEPGENGLLTSKEVVCVTYIRSV